MASPPFTPAALDEIAEYLVSDRDTHRVLNRKFAELGISEQLRSHPHRKKLGLKRGVDFCWGLNRKFAELGISEQLRSHPHRKKRTSKRWG